MLNDDFIGFRYTVSVIHAVCCDIFQILVENLGVKDIESSMSCMKHERLR